MNVLLTLSAVLEAGVGVALLFRPSVVASLLFGSPLGSDAAKSLGRVTGTATTMFPFAEFGLTQPRVPVVLSVSDSIKLEYTFALVPKQ